MVWSLAQTGGRGRRGRVWESAPGNLYCSVLLRPEMPLGRMALCSFLAAVALVDAVRGMGPALDVRCKWPNDVLCGGRKIAGILLEAGEGAGEGAGGGAREGGGTRAPWLVLGMGVNIAHAPEIPGLLYPAGCLREMGCDVPAGELLAALCARLDDWIGRWRNEGFAPVREAWLERAAGVGAEIRVRLERETVTGVFSGLDEDGALLLRLADGERKRVLAGDVFFAASLTSGAAPERRG